MSARMIQSLLDTDFYKFTMGQLIYHRYADVPVRYRRMVRTPGVSRAARVAEADLRRELDHIRTLRLSPHELDYLRGIAVADRQVFHGDYLAFLERLQLPQYELEREGGSYRLEFAGAWAEAIYWETLALAVVTELYYASLAQSQAGASTNAHRSTGDAILDQKIGTLAKHPEVTFSDFGTRRRFSRAWHEHVVERVKSELPRQLLGTSNVLLAAKLGIPPVGTAAHELFMGIAGIMHESDDAIRKSQHQILQDWWDEYGWGLSIALTDTFGSDYFFSTVDDHHARAWKGLRQDSGDPFEYGEKAIAFYRSRGVDPKEKLLMFTDGMDVDSMIALAERFAGRIKVAFGWGTNLTNDVGFTPISIVIKLVEAAGQKTVKLSDNLAKATGDPADIARYKRIFGYTATYSDPPKY